MKKTSLPFLLACCALLGMSGCTGKDSGSSSVPESTTASQTTTVSETTQTTASQTTTESTTKKTTTQTESQTTESTTKQTTTASASETKQTTVTTEAPRSSTSKTTTSTSATEEKPRALRALDSLHAAGSALYAKPAGGSLAAVMCSETYKDMVYIVDVKEDKILHSVKLKNETSLIGVSGGEVVTMCYAGNGDKTETLISFYNWDTGEKNTVSLGEYNISDVQIDPADGSLYAYGYSGAFRVTRSGSITPIVRFDDDQYREGVKAFDAYSKRLLTSVNANNDYTGLDIISYTLGSDAKTLNRTFSVPDFNSNCMLTGSYMLRADWIYDSKKYTSSNNFFVFNADGKEVQRYLGSSDDVNIYSSPQADTLLLVSMNDNWRPSAVHLVDVATGSRTKMNIAMSNARISTACYLPDCGIWAYFQTERRSGKEKTRVLTIDPQYAELTVSAGAPVAEGYANIKPLGKELAEERKYADEIEQKYGIRLMIGNEVTRLQDYCSFKLVSTEERKAEWYYETPELLHTALEYLDQQLARYPEGFFDKFRRSDGIGGLRMLITQELPSNDPNLDFVAGGVQFGGSGNPFYDIAINRDMVESGATIHHELWHAVENLLSQNQTCFETEEWMKLNPKGFEYNGLEDYYNSKWCDYLVPMMPEEDTPDKDPYFARNYSFATIMEDRSTIVEFMFDSFWNTEMEEKYGNGYNQLMSYPHMRAKIENMEKELEKFYGYVYWKEMLGVG